MPQFIKTLLAKPLVLTGTVIIIVGGGYFVFGGGGGGEAATLTIHPADFKAQVAVSGTVVSAEHVELGFSGSGRIAGVYAKVGDRVVAGSLLATIENGDLVATVAQKKA